MHRLFLALAALFLLGSPAPPQAREGILVIVGGGGTTEAIQKATLELCKEPARVVVLPQASGREDRGASSVEMWLEAGAAEAVNLDPLDFAKARDALAEADIVWMPGGSQSRLLEALSETRVDELVRTFFEKGGIVGGTSAGAAVMTELMVVGGDTADLKSIHAGGTLLDQALGLWKEAIVDQHFVARQRNNRLLSAVLDQPDRLGVGIDERTAVIVSGVAFRVIGEGSVLVYDARKAKVSETVKGERSAATGLALHVLRSGMTFGW